MKDLKAFVDQKTGFISADVGRNLTLRCSYDSDATNYYWYKQSLGQKPQLISMSYKLEKKGTFYNQFKDNSRFNLETEAGKSQLKISDLQLFDTGTYLCATSVAFLLTFGKGVTVTVKDSVLKNKAFVNQSDSETVQPGGSVTLNCTVQTGICSGEHKVYWYRNSAKYEPGLINTQGGRDDQCVINPKTETQTCVYNLPMKNLNKDHVGTYYCAVASCGQILFGNGTKLELERKAVSPGLVYSLSAVLILTTIITVLLALMLYKKHKEDSFQTSVYQGKPSTSSAASGEEHCVLYAAVDINQDTRSRKQRKSQETECVYSCMKQ